MYNTTMEAKKDWKDLTREVPAWFRDAKFGLFFHWGPYSVPAYKNEWYSRNMYDKGNAINLYHVKTYGPVSEYGYKDFYNGLTGDKFNAEEWADLVVRSGARYAGPVTEHSDNFSLWDSKVNPINCVNYGPKRDVLRECADAFRKRGIRLLTTFHHHWLWGWFMSSDPDADVYDPANEVYYGKALPLETNRYAPYRLPDEPFNKMWIDKVVEVIDHYDPDIVYFDSRTNIIEENVRKALVEYFYRREDVILTHKQEDFPKGVGLLDIECGSFEDTKPFPWQTDDRLEDNVTWCMVQDPKYKSAKRIIHQLCDIVSKNGNLLLNVGPYADGSFHETAKAILYEIGDWLKINGEAIYGTRPFVISGEGPSTIKDSNYDVEMINAQLENTQGDAGDLSQGTFTEEDFRFTTKGDTLYAIGMGWPKNGIAKIYSLKKGGYRDGIASVSLLGSDAPVSFTQTEECLEIRLPQEKPCSHAYALKIE